MQYFFRLHEENFREWVKSGFVGTPETGIVFLKNLSSPHFKPKMELFSKKQWKMQVEAIQRCVYCFEILGEKDLLTNIVTGGGKTTVIGAIIAYMMIVHNQTKFLILTPNTIVRERLVDDFDSPAGTYIYNTLILFHFLLTLTNHLKIEFHCT